MALWGGRFSQSPADSLLKLSRSVEWDWVLAQYDIRVNLVHIEGLVSAKVLTADQAEALKIALISLSEEIEAGSFSFSEDDEDVHSAIERGLTEKLGELGGAIRAGRSRNDLVVTDFKLYIVDHIVEVGLLTIGLIRAFNRVADEHKSTIAPGFTHLQHAQPIYFGHELAKHSQGLLRDLGRIQDWLIRNNISPLGSGALAGSALQLTPEKSASALGFESATKNSIDAVSDRDFVTEALFIFAQIGLHLSRIGEEFTLWSTTEFGWAKLDDAFSTGSSIMPQKKNPDIAELARGKSGRLLGNLTSVMTTLKGLPFAYNRDLQEDKEPLFDSVETLLTLLPALTGMVESTTFDVAKMKAGALTGHALATEIADFLALKGVPFAHAHEISGSCVRLADSLGLEVHQLSAEQFAAVDSGLTSEILARLTGEGALASRTAASSTSTASLNVQIHELQALTQSQSDFFVARREQFREMMEL